MKAQPTRIEIVAVTVVALLAILVILPLTGRARDQAKSAVCMANLHMLTQAWLDYATDNAGRLCNGFVPRDARYANASYWSSYGFVDNAWWVNPPHNDQGTYTGNRTPCLLSDEMNGIQTGKLFPHIESVDAYHCPNDRDYLRRTDRGGWRSYAITGLMNGEQCRHAHCVRTTDEIVNPAAKYVILENPDLRGWNIGSWIVNCDRDSPSWVDPVGIYHGDGTALGFADGHAETHTWLDKSTLDMADSGSFYWPINWAGGEGRDIAYMARGYIPDRR